MRFSLQWRELRRTTAQGYKLSSLGSSQHNIASVVWLALLNGASLLCGLSVSSTTATNKLGAAKGKMHMYVLLPMSSTLGQRKERIEFISVEVFTLVSAHAALSDCRQWQAITVRASQGFSVHESISCVASVDSRSQA
jgi:hypothetical protein